MDSSLEPPDQYIPLARAGHLSGLAPGTLKQQIYRGKLRAVKLSHDYLTTRQWLHDYLTAADAQTRGTRKPLPPDYIAP
jgi:hypothetical protein